MKKVPKFLAAYLEVCGPQERLAFLGELPSFYFDYTEMKPMADFLTIFFQGKVERGEPRDLNKHLVSMSD